MNGKRMRMILNLEYPQMMRKNVEDIIFFYTLKIFEIYFNFHKKQNFCLEIQLPLINNFDLHIVRIKKKKLKAK